MIEFQLDVNYDAFFLSGDFKSISQYRRFQKNIMSFGGEMLPNDTLRMPFSVSVDDSLSTKETQFKNLEKLAEKFGFTFQQSQAAIRELESINFENEAFSDFTRKAKAIRDNVHDIGDIRNFIKAVEQSFPLRRLYKLQLLSAYHLAFSQNACNFSVPGAGKTSIVYAAFAYLKSLPETDVKHVNRLLIISPLAAFFPWKDEFFKCFNRVPSFKELVGLTPKEREAFFYSSTNTELALISYQSATSSERDVKNIIDYLKRYKVMVVLDEAHRIKNTSGGKTAEGIMQLAKAAKARVVLTGTPAPNGYQDIYNLFKFIWPNKDVIHFPLPYLEQISNDYTSSSKASVLDLIDRISPYFMRVKKSDLGLPVPINHEPIYVEMDEQQRAIYSSIESKYISSFELDEVDKNSFMGKLQKAKLVRLMQCVTNPSLLMKPIENHFEENGSDEGYLNDDEVIAKILNYAQSSIVPPKFIKLEQLLQTIISKQGPEGKVIVWTIFVGNMHHLQDYLRSKDIKSELLYGATPNENEDTSEDMVTREKIIGRFHDDDCPYKVIIANPFAVGESISLHKACHNAIYLEKNFNAAMYMQSKDRVHRYGLSKNDIINYYHLLSKDSIDKVIHSRVLMKEDRMLNLIESEEIPLLSLNMDDSNSVVNQDDFKAVINDYYARKALKD